MTSRNNTIHVSDSVSNSGDETGDSGGSLFSRSPSPVGESGKERWRMSEPPQEVFEEDIEWKYQIIGEEVDHNGNIVYEVEWEDWYREDGSNTTWETAHTISDTPWKQTRQKVRNEMANKTLSVKLMTTTDIHNTETFLRNEAYNEKLAKYSKQKEPNLFDQMAKLMAKHEANDQQGSQGSSSSSLTSKMNQRSSTRQQTEQNLAESSKSRRSSSRLSSKSSLSLFPGYTNSSPKSCDTSLPSTSHSYYSPKPSSSTTSVISIAPSTSQLPATLTPSVKRKNKRIILDTSSPESISFPSSSRKDSSLSRRLEFQQAWTAEAQSTGAAPVYIVNNIDDEELPDIDPNFRYIENSYIFAPGIEKPSDDFLLWCSCKKCTKAINCDCQQPSFLLDAKAIPFFAYKSGLFAFNVTKGIEVIECNKLCACAKKPNQCPNRVSQLPRKHPIEIFKTPTRGWGARSTNEVKRGQVLGIFSGLVITREAALALPTDLSKYRFDLDGDELEDGEDENTSTHGLYSVDSRLHGNWTRFINHSCVPNLQIYLVVHDTPPGIGLPYVAFVANRNIPIREELTLDYNPGQMLTMETMEDGADPCQCGSSQCRGFLTF